MSTAGAPKSKLRQFVFLLFGILAFLTIGIVLENEVGLPFETTGRIGCAIACLTIIYKLALELPGERWLRTSFWIALIVNGVLFFTPLMDRPISRGELMIFALPDAVVLLALGSACYPADDVRKRAVRQQIVLGLVVAILLCATLFGLVLMEPRNFP